MKTRMLMVALIASAALVSQAQAGSRQSGSSGGGHSFASGPHSSGFSGVRSFGGTNRMMYSGQRFSSMAARPSTFSANRFNSINSSANAFSARRFNTTNFNNNSNVNRFSQLGNNSRFVKNGNQFNGQKNLANLSSNRNGTNQFRNRNSNLPNNWQNHVVGQRSANWQKNWNKNSDHIWHGHHCRFINGSWVIFDFGFFPWGPWWWDWYPYDYYAYGYPYGYDPNAYDNDAYYGQQTTVAPYSGSIVMDAQNQLARQGYYNGAIDGELGPQTRDAIARYQNSHGLSATGALTPDTIRSLGLQRVANY